MWAAYIKEQPEQEILNNHCLGKEYSEKENTAETEFMIKFLELFPKDMKYFLAENFQFESGVKEILDMYKEFLTINKGFVESKNNTDILLPQGLIIKNAETFKGKIDEVLKSEDLSKLVKYKGLICKI